MPDDVLTSYGWQEATKRAPAILFAPGLAGGYGEPPPASTVITPYLYAQSAAVNAAVTAYANRVASTPLNLKRLRRGGEYEDLTTHPALDVLENPNPFMTKFRFVEYTVGDLLLSGNAYWFLAGPDGGAPAEVWRLNPRFTRIVRSTTEYISGYVTEIDGILIPLSAGEVIHFRLSNFLDEDGLYGLSKLATAALAAHTGLAMQKWNRSIFAHDYAVPAGIVSVAETLSDPQFDRVKTEWRESYGGPGRKTAIIRGGQVSWESVGLTQTEVDFLNGAKWTDEQVYRVFGTYHLLPAAIADDRKVNERQFLEEHAWPLCVYLAEVLSDQYFSFWGRPAGRPGYLKAEYEDIRPRERALDLEEKRAKEAKSTVNEARALDGMDPVDGGDDVMYVHMTSGEKLQFEKDALPEPPPQLAPFTTPPEPPAQEDDSDAAVPEDAQERAELRESGGDDTGDEVDERFQKAADAGDLHRELRAWERFVIKRWESEDARPFRPRLIPPLVAELTQRALDQCEDIPAVKAAFGRLHELVDGKLDVSPALKASLGVPDGTVVVYLAAVEDLLKLQQVYMQSHEPDAPIRWTPYHQLHMTLVHSPLVDAVPFRQVFQETAAFEGAPVRVTEITTFEGAGDTIPLVALVEKTGTLAQLQQAIYQAFALRGIAVSAYSQPDQWTPHITLGYVDKAYAQGKSLGMMGIEATCRADMLSFTRGDYVHEYSRVAPRPDPLETIAERMFPYGYDEATVKAIQATRIDFDDDMETLLAAAREADIDRREWANRMRTLLRKYGERAFRDGLNDGGIVIGDTEPLDPEDLAEVTLALAEQSQYVTQLGKVLFKEDGISDDQATQKPDLWWNKAIMPLYHLGRLSADKNGMYEWVLGVTEEHCTDCARLAGQVHRLRDWARREFVPPTNRTECGGWLCDCKLAKTTRSAQGQF